MNPITKNRRLRRPADCFSLLSTNATGDKTYAALSFGIHGYLYGKTTTKLNSNGQQVISSQQYIVDDVNFALVKEGDKIRFANSTLLLPIIATEEFRRSDDILDFGVLYFK